MKQQEPGLLLLLVSSVHRVAGIAVQVEVAIISREKEVLSEQQLCVWKDKSPSKK